MGAKMSQRKLNRNTIVTSNNNKRCLLLFIYVENYAQFHFFLVQIPLPKALGGNMACSIKPKECQEGLHTHVVILKNAKIFIEIVLQVFSLL